MANELVVREHDVLRDYNEMCRNCIGTGNKNGTKCPLCEGHGVVNVIKEIHITVKPINTNKIKDARTNYKF
ncbi:MAG: hypothetical protein WCL00_02200 [Bacteroidota bacterium]